MFINFLVKTPNKKVAFLEGEFNIKSILNSSVIESSSTSVARGDYRPDSDIDILVVSDYHKDIWPEISTIIGDTVLEKGELLSIHVMSENIFNETKDYSFLTNVLKEGIILEGN